MNTRTLLIIDVQNDYFPGGAFPLPHMAMAAERLRAFLADWRASGGAVVHVQHVANRPGVPFFLPETAGVELHESVRPLPEEPVVVKHFANSFRETTLGKELEALGAKELVVAGAMSNNCVEATVRAATDMGYGCTVLGDCCAACALSWNGVDVAAEVVHAASMEELAFGYCTVTLSGDFA